MKAEIVNEPKIVLYSVVRGGDNGEKTLGVYFSFEEAFKAFWLDCLDCWGCEFNDLVKGLKQKPFVLTNTYFHDIFHKFFFKLVKENVDGAMYYLYNGTEGCFPPELIDKFSSSWWWMTKHFVDIPSNLGIIK